MPENKVIKLPDVMLGFENLTPYSVGYVICSRSHSYIFGHHVESVFRRLAGFWLKVVQLKY